MATSTPRAMVIPRLAFSAATATSGPGWGGTRPCTTDSPAGAAIPTRIRGSCARRETSTMTDMSSTRPISKNIGRPMSAPTSAIAQGSARALERSTMVSTIWSAPPEAASRRPNLPPTAISVPTLATVDPTPRPETDQRVFELHSREPTDRDRADREREKRVELELCDEQDDQCDEIGRAHV